MKRIVQGEDLAVPGSSNKRPCERCFALVDASAVVCGECGAPLVLDRPFLVADAAAHRDLAEANLMRVRGELDQAEKKCLVVLRQYPNDPAAHTLLGEIEMDRADWGRAIEWFELALELNPSSVVDREKLAEARIRQESHQELTTAEQIGLPASPGPSPWVAASLVAAVVVISFGAWAAVNIRKQPASSAPMRISVTAPPPAAATSATPASPTPEPPTTEPIRAASVPPVATSVLPGQSQEDRTIAQLVQQRSTEGQRVVQVSQDPRTKHIHLSFTASSGDDFRRIAATLARDTLNQVPEALIVTIRGVSGGQSVYVADATRTRLVETQEPAWANQHPESDAWIGHLLQNEWPAATAPSVPAGGNVPDPGT